MIKRDDEFALWRIEEPHRIAAMWHEYARELRERVWNADPIDPDLFVWPWEIYSPIGDSTEESNKSHWEFTDDTPPWLSIDEGEKKRGVAILNGWDKARGNGKHPWSEPPIRADWKVRAIAEEFGIRFRTPRPDWVINVDLQFTDEELGVAFKKWLRKVRSDTGITALKRTGTITRPDVAEARLRSLAIVRILRTQYGNLRHAQQFMEKLDDTIGLYTYANPSSIKKAEGKVVKALTSMFPDSTENWPTVFSEK